MYFSRFKPKEIVLIPIFIMVSTWSTTRFHLFTKFTNRPYSPAFGEGFLVDVIDEGFAVEGLGGGFKVLNHLIVETDAVGQRVVF